MKKYVRIGIILIIWFSYTFAHAQQIKNGSLTGKIVENSTKTPMERANILISNLVTSDSTIHNNYFKLYPFLHLAYYLGDNHDFRSTTAAGYARQTAMSIIHLQNILIVLANQLRKKIKKSSLSLKIP